MKKRLHFGFWLLFLLSANFALAQVHATASPDSNLAETGCPFRVRVRVPAQAGKPQGIQLEAWEAMLQKENVLQQEEWQQIGPNWEKRLLFISFDADTLHFAPIPVVLSNGDTLFTNAFSLPVLASPAPSDLNDMADIKNIHQEGANWTDYWIWYLAAGFVGLLALLTWLYLRRQKKGFMQSRVVQLPPHALALKRLEALQRQNWLTTGQYKAFYEELTLILRSYLRDRFHIPAMESASPEIVRLLQTLPDFPEEYISGAKDLLEKADLVKFAKAQPDDSYHIPALEWTKALVHSTRPIEQPSPTSTDKS